MSVVERNQKEGVRLRVRMRVGAAYECGCRCRWGGGKYGCGGVTDAVE